MKKLLAILLTVATLVTVLSVIVFQSQVSAAETGTGFATANNTAGYYNATKFYIGTVQDLKEFAEDTYIDGHNYEGKTVYLTSDIVVNNTSAANWYSTATVMPSICGSHWYATDSVYKDWGFAGVF